MNSPRYLRCSHARQVAAIAAVSILMVCNIAFASSAREKVIHSFLNSPDGVSPAAALVADSAGNLYGTTIEQGDPLCGCGMVFELTPPAAQGGAWTENVLYSFQGGDADGAGPHGALIFDKLGNLYGTTESGGLNNQGTVFELSPPSSSGGTWMERVLYFFPADGSGGGQPLASLIFDSAGNLYGTALVGGSSTLCPIPAGCGTLFELTPPATPGGAWNETVLHNFGAVVGDGFSPNSGLIRGRTGTLFGATLDGGMGVGTIFQLVREHGRWAESVIYSFEGSDGASPGTPTLDNAGNLYDTAALGALGNGVAFELTPPPIPGHPWTYAALYNFTGHQDGYVNTGSGVILESGNLYGTATRGGLKGSLTKNNGTIFELSPPAVAGGAWTETTLHEFSGSTYGDGTMPLGKLIFVKGKFYGITSLGGLLGKGTAFSLAIVP
jgi:uncharacterized repeat protein (TIGR03803 family)